MQEAKLEKIKRDDMVDISVVLVHYKTPGLLRQCIESIYKVKPNVSFEIIVVDNNSGDNTPQWIDDDFPEVVMIANKDNRGFPKAVNQGVRKARGRYILLLNPDITVLEDSMDELFKYMETHKEVGLVGPKLINPNGSLQKSCFKYYPNTRIILYRRTFLGNFNGAQKVLKKFTMDEWDHNEEKEVAWVLGSSMLVRREAIEDIGLMDERFFMYMEDVDWCRRLWQNGWKVMYFPHVKMVHYYARASADNANAFAAFFNKQTRIHIASGVKFLLKYAKKNKSKTKTSNSEPGPGQ